MMPVWPTPPGTFCPHPGGRYALTICSVDPEAVESWRRELAPVCVRCHGILRRAGEAGRIVKATGERWFLGHGVGRFEPVTMVREF